MNETATKRWFGWAPYAMLGYLAFFFAQPALDGAGWRQWAATLAGGAVFVALYFGAYAARGRKLLAVLVAMVVLGLAFVPTNAAALVFFIYAGLFVPFYARPRAAAALLSALVAVVLAQAFALHFPTAYWLPATLCPVVAGIVNISVAERRRADARLRLAQEEVEQLAKIAERERIARDMHDVLGHTMSVIALKSELASKLVDRDPERAKAEIDEVQKISREALAEIREAIRGYRTEGLAAELERARRTLETAGVAFACQADPIGIEPARENVLALVMREAVTNVVRHAHARACRVGLAREGDAIRLEIADDGRGAGSGSREGNGIRGMRERVEALGGSLRLENVAGTTLTVTLPAGGGAR